ncbi:AIPR family protein [Terrisporobacter petrolearius]|uniref:AIPR family protein n=1 Tax=Terrisporobacter petrolearius TaxID=1460447 RepID=UPI001D16814E|nr:AIPR family protein [Terrisporobacter petrolearius]MCC3863901.1 AIPR family protein [Terrisporobacter petrolearius]
MIELNEFHKDFMQSIFIEAESRGLMKSQAFFENICEELVNIGDLTNNYTFAEYRKTGMEAYGYDYDEERKILSILVHNFFQEDEIQTLTKSDINKKYNRIKTFYKKSITGLYEDLEETSEAHSMAYNIFKYKYDNKIDKVRFIILTDGKISSRFEDISSESIDDIKAEYRIVDIDYIYKIYLSQYSNSGFKINVNLPCLEIPTKSDEYEAYLTVIGGQDLVDIYDEHGQKLFEQNVRTFLQFKGAVNKGIKNTIEYKSDMFFAYNNGITATASSIERNSEGEIVLINDFQIVNGGQTTSAIYAASKNSKLDVSNVSVPMKLSVVKDKDKQNDFVSKVSEYANTQNKVNKSDFFSNSPFHKEMKDYSKRIWAPVCDGSQKRTRWFYERVRGEYLNEQAYLTKAKKKQYQMEYPKKQLIDKTFLSKSENAWLQNPHIVCKGAQYSFSHFADQITNNLEKDNLCITESYFIDAVSRIILFKEVEKLVSKATWYDGGFRAQTVAYSISYLSYIIEKKNKFLNFNVIWENQSLPTELVDSINVIIEAIYKEITNPPTGYANIAQWAKQKLCWDSIKELNLGVIIDPKLLIDKEAEKYNKKEEQKIKKIDDGIQTQMKVCEIDIEIWKELYSYYKDNMKDYNLSMTKLDILKKMSIGKLAVPSEKQSKILYDLYLRAEEDGVKVTV